MQIELAPEFGYVLITTVLVWFMNVYLGERVALARKKLGVPLPLMYAGDGTEKGDAAHYAFNVLQRGHQNMLETLPDFFVGHIVAGVYRPQTVSVLALLYVIGRIVYAVMYSAGAKTGSLGKRVYGSVLFIIARIGHLVIFAELAYALLTSA